MGYAQAKKYIEGLTNFQKALEIYKLINYKLKQSHSLYFIGKMYLKLKNYEAAIKYYNEAVIIAQQIKEKELYADILFDLALAYSLQKKFNKSMNIYRQVLKIYKKLEKNPEQGEVYFEMGKILREMGNEHYQEAYKNFKNALKIMTKENQQKFEIDCRNQIGDLLLLLDQPQEALNNYEKALKKSKKYNDVLGEVTAYFGRGKSLYELKNYKKAIVIFNLVVEFYRKIKYLKGEIACLTYLSNSYEKTGDKEKTEKYKKLAQNISKKLEM